MANCENFKVDLLWIIVLVLVFFLGTGMGVPQEELEIIVPA